jgi:LacI family transcriptional regulator/LacI family asc operon transcriptional repressor
LQALFGKAGYRYKVNIYDVSQKAGVSIATVSRVLNGNHSVAESTRKRVEAAIKELGYEPNVFARGLGLNTMQTIGILCNDSSDIYIANAVYYLQHFLSEHHYDSILCCTGNNPDDFRKYTKMILSKRVDAVIYTGSQFILNQPDDHDNSYILDASKEVPIFLLNGILEGENIYCVVNDDHLAIHDAAAKLIRDGRRHIVYLYSGTTLSSQNKLSGFTDALNEAGIPNRIEYTHLGPKDIYAAKSYLETLYEKGMPINAVLASEDTLAVGAVKFAEEHGIRIPEDMEIIGYNNSILAECTEPELTSIDNHVEKVCRTLTDNCLKVLSGEEAPHKVVLTAVRVDRKTTVN